MLPPQCSHANEVSEEDAKGRKRAYSSQWMSGIRCCVVAQNESFGKCAMPGRSQITAANELECFIKTDIESFTQITNMLFTGHKSACFLDFER